MLVRKTAFVASIFSGLFSISQADAACFGKRSCCQSTPVVCPPCPAPAPMIAPARVIYYNSTPTSFGSPCIPCDPCGSFGSGVSIVQASDSQPQIVGSSAPQYRTEMRTRTHNVTRYRTETRSRMVRDPVTNQLMEETYSVQVPYTEQIERTEEVRVPIDIGLVYQEIEQIRSKLNRIQTESTDPIPSLESIEKLLKDAKDVLSADASENGS